VLLSSSIEDCKRVTSEQPGGCIIVTVSRGGDVSVDVFDLHMTCDASFISLMTTVTKLVTAVSSTLHVQSSPSPAAAALPLVTISCPTAEILFRTLQANDTRPLVDQVSDTHQQSHLHEFINPSCVFTAFNATGVFTFSWSARNIYLGRTCCEYWVFAGGCGAGPVALQSYRCVGDAIGMRSENKRKLTLTHANAFLHVLRFLTRVPGPVCRFARAVVGQAIRIRRSCSLRRVHQQLQQQL
jgi:hypothetical protein